MKIMILGADGYLGWPLTLYLREKGHEVLPVDSFVKRDWVHSMDVRPLIELPVAKGSWRGSAGKRPRQCIREADIKAVGNCRSLFDQLGTPDAIVHLAEQPSAPFSMTNTFRAIQTQKNNVIGTLALMFAVKERSPETHIVKLGSMGEYGTPNIDIEEGWLDVEHNGRKDRVLYPKRPGSFYHLSKVHDSGNLEFGCRAWGLRVTDLNQGVVYGTHTPLTSKAGYHTAIYYDAIFGTVLNRFLAQAVLKKHLTVYGSGRQTRGFLNINDTLRCIELACENPAAEGEFRVFNQFTETFSVLDLARKVSNLFGVRPTHLENPRTVEQEYHYYNAKHTALTDLGLEPTLLTDEILWEMFEVFSKHRNAIDPTTIQPEITWK